jgi:hypothetical protein
MPIKVRGNVPYGLLKMAHGTMRNRPFCLPGKIGIIENDADCTGLNGLRNVVTAIRMDARVS